MERRRTERKPFRKTRRSFERIQALGAEMDLVRPEEVMHHVEAAVEERRPFLVANHNLHSLYLLRRDARLARFFAQADVIEVDSTPLIAFLRLLGLHGRPFHRCTYLDWRAHFWSLADRKAWRVYYLGGAPGVAEAAADQLARRYPGAVLQTRNGYFDPEGAENAAVLADIKGFDPHILFVGMGMPRQEVWISENRAQLPPCAAFSVGAAFDYEAGVQSAAPRWLGRIGLEWLYRLAHDPARLWRRYCWEPWFLLGPALSDITAAVRQGRFLRRPKTSGGLARVGVVGQPVPVQDGVHLGIDRVQPTRATQAEEGVVVQCPEPRLVDRQEA